MFETFRFNGLRFQKLTNQPTYHVLYLYSLEYIEKFRRWSAGLITFMHNGFNMYYLLSIWTGAPCFWVLIYPLPGIVNRLLWKQIEYLISLRQWTLTNAHFVIYLASFQNTERLELQLINTTIIVLANTTRQMLPRHADLFFHIWVNFWSALYNGSYGQWSSIQPNQHHLAEVASKFYRRYYFPHSFKFQSSSHFTK